MPPCTKSATKSREPKRTISTTGNLIGEIKALNTNFWALVALLIIECTDSTEFNQIQLSSIRFNWVQSDSTEFKNTAEPEPVSVERIKEYSEVKQEAPASTGTFWYDHPDSTRFNRFNSAQSPSLSHTTLFHYRYSPETMIFGIPRSMLLKDISFFWVMGWFCVFSVSHSTSETRLKRVIFPYTWQQKMSECCIYL